MRCIVETRGLEALYHSSWIYLPGSLNPNPRLLLQELLLFICKNQFINMFRGDGGGDDVDKSQKNVRLSIPLLLGPKL